MADGGGQDRPDRAAIAAAARRLAGGGLAIVPTETFYALSADPRRPDAVERARELKHRPAGKPLPLLAASPGQVDRIARGWRSLDLARRLAARFWPGPLTLVLPASGVQLAVQVLGEDGGVAVRCSSHPWAGALAAALGFPIVSTSANRAGEPPPTTAESARNALGEAAGLVVLDAGPVPGGRPSTIVDVRRGRLDCLREGAIPLAELRAAVAEREG